MRPSSPTLERVAVDLTPLLPGGENGGAGLVAVQLVRSLARLAPAIRFTLLTHHRTHHELAQLDAPNVERVCVVGPPGEVEVARSRTRQLGRAVLDHALPSAPRVWVKNSYWSMVRRRARARTSTAMRSDVLFCPFTAPYYHDPAVPLVAIIHDLQHLAYPEFFEADQRRYRQEHVVDACRRAARVVCISEHARQTLLASVAVPPERVTTIPHALLHTLETPPPTEINAVLQRLGVQRGRFLLYPANGWPHKNHRRLVDAFAEFTRKRPASDLRVVCTGAADGSMQAVAEYARQQAPGAFVFAGYVSDPELSSLYDACAALVFPSLYEGFGMPVLEAMARGKPVLCSSVTSLPEIVGDAALLFDPTNVGQIAEAIDAVESQPLRVRAIAQRGPRQAARFGGPMDLARRYLEVFRGVADDARLAAHEA
jgi:glycosyltransferase involved in cell wall biosynthesis